MFCIRKKYYFSIILQSFITENENGIGNTAHLPDKGEDVFRIGSQFRIGHF